MWSKIRAMKMLRWIAVGAFLSTLCCSAQLMDSSRHRDYLSGLDGGVERWQKQISGMDFTRLNVSPAKAKLIEDFRRSTLGDLRTLRSLIQEQRSAAEQFLSGDVKIAEQMADAYIGLQDLLDALPSDGPGSFLQGSLTPVMTELQDQRFPLRSHIVAYADNLQAKVKTCSK